MSVNIVVKDKDRVYVAVDSQVTAGDTKAIFTNPNSIKMWKVNGIDNCIMAHCGDYRDACLIRTMNLAGGASNIDFSFVVNEIVPNIVQELINADYISIANKYIENCPSTWFVVCKDKAFAISDKLAVVEIEDYSAHGSGKYNALGSLASTTKEKPLDRIKKAIKASANNNIYVDFPIYVMDTKTMEIKTINKEEL